VVIIIFGLVAAVELLGQEEHLEMVDLVAVVVLVQVLLVALLEQVQRLV
jgi:hypothetical protein